jgi:hypothetical protein
MDDLIAREVTTVPGLINLAGAGVLVGAKSLRPLADRVAVWLLMFNLHRQRDLKPEDSKKFWEVVQSVMPPPMSMGEFALVAAIFIAYNGACVWLVGGGP